MKKEYTEVVDKLSEQCFRELYKYGGSRQFKTVVALCQFEYCRVLEASGECLPDKFPRGTLINI